MRKVYEHSGLIEERIYLGGFEIYRKYTGTDITTATLDDERETLHVSDDARRVCMIETLTLSSGSAPSPITSRYRYQLDNHLGTCCVETDENGAVISYEEFHPYGTSAYRAMKSGVEVSARRYRYVGKEKDDETKLYLMGARYYAAFLARWTAADPAGTVDGTNLYAYVRGSPIGLVDPSGTESFSAVPDNEKTFVDLQREHDEKEQLKAQAAASLDKSGGNFNFGKAPKRRRSVTPRRTGKPVFSTPKKGKNVERYEALPEVREFELSGNPVKDEAKGTAYSLYNIGAALVNTVTTGLSLPFIAAREAGASDLDVSTAEGLAAAGPAAAAQTGGLISNFFSGLSKIAAQARGAKQEAQLLGKLAPATMAGLPGAPSGGSRARINLRHIFHGEVNRRGRAVGFHHEGSVGHAGRARVTSRSAPNAQGVYEGTVEVFDATQGAWVAKSTPSTFFPSAWSRGRVLQEIRGAFGNRATVAGRPANYWEGVSPSGIRIGGYLDPSGNINTAFPIRTP